MRVTILPSAWEDLAEGFRFYEQQGPGLGEYFRAALIADIDSLGSLAGIHRKVFGRHRLLAKRFPFAVYYSVEADVVVVRGVLDCRRSPTWVRRKLQ